MGRTGKRTGLRWAARWRGYFCAAGLHAIFEKPHAQAWQLWPRRTIQLEEVPGGQAAQTRGLLCGAVALAGDKRPHLVVGRARAGGGEDGRLRGGAVTAAATWTLFELTVFQDPGPLPGRRSRRRMTPPEAGFSLRRGCLALHWAPGSGGPPTSSAWHRAASDALKLGCTRPNPPHTLISHALAKRQDARIRASHIGRGMGYSCRR